MSYPTAFIEESSETLCLELFDENKSGASITVKVFAEESNEQQRNENWIFDKTRALQHTTARLEKNVKNKCFELTLPRCGGVSKGLLEIEIRSDDERLDVRTFREITIYQQEIYPLLQTDKGQYKAKDKVKFRVLLLDQNLKPTKHLDTIDEIWVEDPRNRRIAQWKDSVSSLNYLRVDP